MNVRFDGHYFICECGAVMMFLDGMWDAPRRRMVCAKKECEHGGKVFLEPVFRAEPAE